MARTYAAESATTKVRANLFNPGPTRTRMRATALPGVDPMTLPTPEEVAKTIVPLCLPGCTENGRLYDFRAGKFLSSSRRLSRAGKRTRRIRAVEPDPCTDSPTISGRSRRRHRPCCGDDDDDVHAR